MVRADGAQSVRPIFRTFQMLHRQVAPTTRAQLVDEGPLNRVYLEQPTLNRRMTVIWSTDSQSREALLSPLGSSAEVMDKFGTVRPLEIDPDGHIRVTLSPATANTIPGAPDVYFIGGEPLLVLEPLPTDYEPLAPTYANLPVAGAP
jgi:hypothetical protein